MKTLVLTVALTFGSASFAYAGLIETACMKSGRTGGLALCNCIQQVADITLSRSDQRQAAKFFSDPHQAQEIRQSDHSSHEAFWQRYKNFGATAEAYCAR